MVCGAKAYVYHSAFGDGFTFVATVGVSNLFNDPNWDRKTQLHKAYHLTNNIDDAWFNNVRVEATQDVMRKGGARSTSVGDFICLLDEQNIMTWWRVDNYGFSKITDDTELEYMGYNEEKTERYFEKLTFRELYEKYGENNEGYV